MTPTSKPTRAIAALALVCSTGLANAATLSKGAHGRAKDEIKTMAAAERETCNTMTGNARDVCVVRAKSKEKVALAHLEFQQTGADKDRKDYLASRIDARYQIESQSCEAKAGKDKDLCQTEVAATRDKSTADMKADLAIIGALEDAQETKWKADFKVAQERCEKLSGTPKDTCVTWAKVRYSH